MGPRVDVIKCLGIGLYELEGSGITSACAIKCVYHKHSLRSRDTQRIHLSAKAHHDLKMGLLKTLVLLIH